jgi:hypothetical protein
VADNKVLFLRFLKFSKWTFTAVNDHFEIRSKEKNEVFLLTLYKKGLNDIMVNGIVTANLPIIFYRGICCYAKAAKI